MQYYAHLAVRRELTKYTQADPELFASEFAQLPPDMNPLNPALIDPRMQLFRPGMGGGRRRQGQGVEDAQEDLDILGWLGEDHIPGDGNPGGAAALAAGLRGLDLNAPLMQLFLQSLLPWTTGGAEGAGPRGAAGAQEQWEDQDQGWEDWASDSEGEGEDE